jgi:hypothetical protein
VDGERGITHDMIFKIDQGQFFVGPVEVWNELGNCLMSGLGKQIEICISFLILHEEIDFNGSALCTYDENCAPGDSPVHEVCMVCLK